MANISLTTFVVVVGIAYLCNPPILAARTHLNSMKSRNSMSMLSSSTANNDSICQSMVISQGYACHEFTVTTEDGYILSVQRMPMGRSGKPADKGPVLVQHGLFSVSISCVKITRDAEIHATIMQDGATWLLNGPGEALAFILADNDYDVWIANTRGTTYSQGHTSLSPSDSAYWEWSWDELAAYDLPAVLQYVHQQTGQKVYYAGHSLGTLMALAAFSQQKLLNLIRSAALLSPIAHLNHIPSPLTKFAADSFLAEELYWLGLREFIPGGQAASKLVESICDKPGMNCSDLITAFTGPNCCVNASKTNSFLDNQPQSTSTKNLIHLAQMIRTGKIAMYDYGNEVENMNHYGKPTPPVYNMTSIPSDLGLFLGYGGQDTLSDVEDVNLLLDDLKGHETNKLVLLFVKNYAHADFVFGVNANQLVYRPLMDFFNLN